MNAIATTMLGRARAVAAVWKNPVVVRDLRVRMRGTRSYWQLAVYLGLLSLLVLAGYASATSMGDGRNIDAVLVQRQLQQFYYFIFFTLAVLISLIAPALTAASVTTERQRQTLDLLVTTPMSSAELLTGKLVSSVAFLGLLLVMSLPASALCVILGGATLGDVLRTYFLLALDGLLLSAVGLYMSCTQKNSMQALTATYGVIILGAIVTSGFIPMLAFSAFTGSSPSLGLLITIATLHPVAAVLAPSATVAVGSLTLPAWPFTAVAAFLAIRLLLTAATYRMGSYGTDALGSLRRQLLLITGLGAFLSVYGSAAVGVGSMAMHAVTAMMGGGMAPGTMAAGGLPATVEGLLLVSFYICVLFLPSLFVPALPEGAASGEAVTGTYDMRKAFRPEHAGALPYFHLWAGTLAGGALLALLLAGAADKSTLARLGLTLLYILATGFGLWSLSRRVAALVPGLSPARGATFAAMVGIAVIPPIVFVLIVGDSGRTLFDVALAPLWVLYPYSQIGTAEAVPSLWTSIVIAVAAGLLLYPPYKRVVPASPRPQKPLPVFGAAGSAE